MKIGGGLNNENLVFGYDSQGFSFGGEPTTNLVPSPQHNSNFTIQNGWSTYNTNQYNSNTYFSIGTIQSVADDIVILNTVGRTIRSFDVLKPQTSGGGVTAGTNYVIKKINDTDSFTLHEYNSSQNGSQGYINPDTGFFKVHDAYANDTRIPINSTNFPTMWWGGPHLPNSGLIKEIVPNEGRRHGTNAMRLHAYRPDGVVDGMAYGVNTPVTQGDVITVSVWLKLADGRGEGKSLGYSTYFGSGFSGSSTSFGPLTRQWRKYEFSWTASNTYSFISYWWPNTPTQPYAIDMCDFMVEINKDEATKFTQGTRSDTESLLDLKISETIDTTNISWTSDGYPEFNGSSNYIDIDSVTLGNGSWSIEVIVNAHGSSYSILSNNSGGPVTNAFGVYSNKMHYRNYDGSWKNHNSDITVNYNEYYHLVWVNRGYNSSMDLYINGIKDNTSGFNSYTTNGGPVNSIGKSWNAYFDGSIPVFRRYDDELTDDEVYQNYMSFKTPFGLS